MPTIQTKSNSRKRKLRHSRTKSVYAESGPQNHQVIVRGKRTTHVLVPLDEYEQYQQMVEATRLTKKLENPNAKWIDFDDFAAEVAASLIVEARKKAGLTQGQLAAKLKMPQSQISRIERNPDSTTVRTLKKIAKALGVEVGKLI